MAQFKVGDLVKVDLSKRSDYSWWDSIQENKVYKVVVTNVLWNSYILKGLPFLFDANWLMPDVPAFKFEIGENVKVGDGIGHIQEQYKSDGENRYLVRFENTRYESLLPLLKSYAICYRESQIEKYEPVLPVKEETKPEAKKRKPLEVFAMLNEYFDWFWDVDKFDLVVGIREGTTDDEESSQPYKRKKFGLDETKQAYKWLLKQAFKIDERKTGNGFTKWYNGQD